MKKSIKNRGVLLKMVLATMVCVLIVATLIAFVGCTNGNYDNNSLTIEFSKKHAKFTLPKDACLRVEKQTKYYVFENVKPKSKKVMHNLNFKFWFNLHITSSTINNHIVSVQI